MKKPIIRHCLGKENRGIWGKTCYLRCSRMHQHFNKGNFPSMMEKDTKYEQIPSMTLSKRKPSSRRWRTTTAEVGKKDILRTNKGWGFSVCPRNSREYRSQPGREKAHSHFSILSISSLALDGITIPEILGKVYICLLRRWYKTPLKRDVEKQNAKDVTVCWKHSSICGNWLSCQCSEPQVSALKRPVLERWSAPCQYILFKKQPGKKFSTEFLSKPGAPKVTLGSGSRCRGISSRRFLTEPASPGWDKYGYIDTLTFNHMFTDLFLPLPSL